MVELVRHVCVFLYIFSFIYSFVLRAAQNILNMIFIGDVLVCALWAVQNVPYMVVIGDVFVYVAQNIHPGGCTTYMVAANALETGGMRTRTAKKKDNRR